jgi:hypothetical protein
MPWGSGSVKILWVMDLIVVAPRAATTPPRDDPGEGAIAQDFCVISVIIVEDLEYPKISTPL